MSQKFLKEIGKLDKDFRSDKICALAKRQQSQELKVNLHWPSSE